MKKLRSNKRQHNNLLAEKSLLLERKNLSQPLKYKKDILSINKTTPKPKSTMEFHSRKSNELTKISKQQIPTTGKYLSVRTLRVSLDRLPQMSSKRAIKPASRLKMTLRPKEDTAADKIKTQLKSKKQQNVLDKKALHISETKLLKSQNKIKEPLGQELHHNNSVIGVSRFPQGSPNKATRSSKYNIRLQSHEFSKNNSGNVQPSVSPKFKKQQDILNEKTPCIPKKIQPRSSDIIKWLERQNDVQQTAVINVSGFINETPNETARSSRRSMRLQSQKFLSKEPDNVNDTARSLRRSMRPQSQEFLSKEPDNVQLSKLSASQEFKKQQNILNEKTPCVPKKLRHKSSNKMKELEGQNNVQQTTIISVSGFINESPNDTARSSRRSMRSQSQGFLSKEPDNVNDTARSLRRSMRPQSQEFLSKELDNVQLSKLSASPKFKKQQNVLNEKTPYVSKKFQLKSSDKIKGLQKQNELHKTTVNVSEFINESPTERSSRKRKSNRLQSREFLKSKSDNVHLSKLSVSPEFKKQQNILNEKTPCMPKKFKLKSSDKIKKLQEQNELHKTAANVCEFLNESPNETARSSRKTKRLQLQEILKNKSDNAQISKRRRTSTIQQKAKELMTPNGKSSKHSALAQSTPYIKKRCAQKSSERLQNPMRPKSLINIPVDDLAFSPIKRQTKSEGHKLPGKNTLKRKRFLFETIKKADEEYEDDIYEEREFTSFINMLPDTSDSELSYSMATPRLGFSLTPQIRCKTPPYKDCFSPAQYALSRKIAEEYLYRNKKRKSKSKPEIPAAVPEKKKIEFDEILENACKVQKEVEKLSMEESDCEDNYFSNDEK